MTGGSGWGSNPPRPATRPAAGFEDREALRDLTTPGDKHTRRGKVLQGKLKGILRLAGIFPRYPSPPVRVRSTGYARPGRPVSAPTHPPAPGSRYWRRASR